MNMFKERSYVPPIISNVTCMLCCCLMKLDQRPRALLLEVVTRGLEPVSNVMLVDFAAS